MFLEILFTIRHFKSVTTVMTAVPSWTLPAAQRRLLFKVREVEFSDCVLSVSGLILRSAPIHRSALSDVKGDTFNVSLTQFLLQWANMRGGSGWDSLTLSAEACQENRAADDELTWSSGPQWTYKKELNADDSDKRLLQVHYRLQKLSRKLKDNSHAQQAFLEGSDWAVGQRASHCTKNNVFCHIWGTWCFWACLKHSWWFIC